MILAGSCHTAQFLSVGIGYGHRHYPSFPTLVSTQPPLGAPTHPMSHSCPHPPTPPAAKQLMLAGRYKAARDAPVGQAALRDLPLGSMPGHSMTRSYRCPLCSMQGHRYRHLHLLNQLLFGVARPCLLRQCSAPATSPCSQPLYLTAMMPTLAPHFRWGNTTCPFTRTSPPALFPVFVFFLPHYIGTQSLDPS
jgi:hypothetical protein